MRCGGGQECKHCRELNITFLKENMTEFISIPGKKFFSVDTLRNHEDACGSLDSYLDTEAQLKDDIVVENSMLIKTEQIEMPPIETREENRIELQHIKTEIEDFV
jgi:hypothetical protein